jgi:hypothetical protein
MPDVALAFWQYQMAAGDPEFLRDATMNDYTPIAYHGRFKRTICPQDAKPCQADLR